METLPPLQVHLYSMDLALSVVVRMRQQSG
jgi:hypothetical protein